MSEKLPSTMATSAESQAVLLDSSGLNGDWRKYAALKVSTEYDSEDHLFTNKISARLMNGLAKFKASFLREQGGELRNPVLGFVSKHLSVLYDHEVRNALVTLGVDLGSHCQMKYARDIKAQQGEAKLLAQSPDLKYKAEISYDLPPTGLSRAALTFPIGQVRLEEELIDEQKSLSINGFVGGTVLNGLLLTEWKDENINLKYRYKDKEVTVAPSISLPMKTPLISFKRQFDHLNKLSYLYNFDSAAWSAVYKHKPNESLKIKVGYDSDVRLAWAAAWLGKEDSGAKQAPRKCKVQVMLQVPQDDPRSAVLLFKVKKRWDL
eukprot:c26814_g1_i2 orf=758-1720(-)